MFLMINLIFKKEIIIIKNKVKFLYRIADEIEN